MHLGTDGASNFTGCHSGVAAQLKKKHPRMIRVHCVAHREALAAADACKEVPYLKETFQSTLAGVFRCFDNSAVRESALHQIQVLLDMAQTKLKEPKFVRWLSHDAAASAFLHNLPAIIAALEREASERHDPAAKAYAKRIKTYKFVASLLLFSDTLPHLTALSKTFQKSNLDYTEVKPAFSITALRQLQTNNGPFEKRIDGALECIGLPIQTEGQQQSFLNSVRQPYIAALIKCLEARFPVMPIHL